MEKGIIIGLSSAVGPVPGPYREESMVCQYTHMVYPQGSIWFGGQPFAYSTTVLMAQFIFIFFVSRAVLFFVKPFRQSLMSAQIIAGILMGPSFLRQNKWYAEMILPPEGKLILHTIADIGLMLHLFLLGVQIDITMLMKAGKDAALIGTIGFALSYVLGGFAVVAIPHVVMLDEKLLISLPLIATVNALTSFPVVTNLLADLNILNSEMGRLATSTSMVGDFWSYFFSITLSKLGAAVRNSDTWVLWSIFWNVVYCIVIFFVIRPLILTIAKSIEGKPMKESHFMFILTIVLACGFCSEVLGQHSGISSFMLGLVIPDGPPFGETLVYKLEAMTTGVLLPAKFVITGLHVNLFSIEGRSAAAVEVLIFFGYIGKFLGTLATAIYCSVSIGDAISLALVMCSKGIVDIAVYAILQDEGILDNQAYALMIITMLIVTGVARTLVGHLYDPSRRYMVHSRRTIQGSYNLNTELRMLVCIHKEENVPSIINLIEASNPTSKNPISVVVLNLMELKGRVAAILVPNFNRGKLTSTYIHSEHIVNAFTNYAEENHGRVILQHFTAVAPYASMHDDICMLALGKDVTFVIVPFHKQWTIDGTVGAVSPSIRSVNKNVMNKVPCSVGLLVDRSQISGSCFVLSSQSIFRVALLFLGGADDREALAYGSRMADHPYVTLTVVWIRPWIAHEKIVEEVEDDVDIELMNEYRDIAMGDKRITVKEEMVEDAVGTLRIVRSMEEQVDLFMVGRNHEPGSSLTSGLTEWSECPELGVIGDTLATSDFRFSVLVVQLQPTGAAFLDSDLKKQTSSGSSVAGSKNSRFHQLPSVNEDYNP